MQGTLQDMTVADLIQHYCQDHKTARLIIEHNGQQAALFFKDGAMPHATLGKLEGEEAIYEVLTWQEGKFVLEAGQEPPATTINRNWSSILLEGARRIDEQIGEPDQPYEWGTAVTPGKVEQLAELLGELLQEVTDIEGVAVVGMDGLVYATNVPQKKLDETVVGTTSAAVFGLSQRSVAQLKRGRFNQTLIQGNQGNIIVAALNAEMLFIGLTPHDVNLGLVFAEMRTLVTRLNASL